MRKRCMESVRKSGVVGGEHSLGAWLKSLPSNAWFLRAVLRHVSPTIIRLVSVPDRMAVIGFHDLFRAILGWTGVSWLHHPRTWAEEFNSLRL